MTAAPAVNTSGSQTASIGTEHSLASITTAKTLWLDVDLSNMSNGTGTPDLLVLTIYKKVRSGDTKQVAFQQHYIGAGNVKASVSPPLGSPAIYWEATLKQVQGTGRAYSWSINEY